MVYVLAFLIGTLVSWVMLLIVVPIARKLADFSMPPWPETLWRLAIVAAAVNLVTIALDPVNAIVSWVAGAIVFFTLMVKWFDVDLFGAVIIVVVSWFARMLILGAVMAAVAGMLN
jgi:hypothetical protein